MSEIKKSELKWKIDRLESKVNAIDNATAASFDHVKRHFDDLGARVAKLSAELTKVQTTATSTTANTATASTKKRVVGVGFGLIPIYEGENPVNDHPGIFPKELSESTFISRVIEAFIAMGLTRDEATSYVNKFISDSKNGFVNPYEGDEEEEEEEYCEDEEEDFEEEDTEDRYL